MNVRISEGVLRFRLGNDDIARLTAGQAIDLALATSPMSRLDFSLTQGQVKSPLLSHVDSLIKVCMPTQELQTWLSSETVEWEYEDSDSRLKIVVEKDLHRNRKAKG